MLCVLNYPHGYVIHIYTCGVCVIRYPTKFSYAFFSFFLVCLFVLSMCVNAQRNFSPPNTSKRSFQPSEYKLYAHSILDMIEQNEECARFHKNPLILSKSRKKKIFTRNLAVYFMVINEYTNMEKHSNRKYWTMSHCANSK